MQHLFNKTFFRHAPLQGEVCNTFPGLKALQFIRGPQMHITTYHLLSRPLSSPPALHSDDLKCQLGTPRVPYPSRPALSKHRCCNHGSWAAVVVNHPPHGFSPRLLVVARPLTPVCKPCKDVRSHPQLQPHTSLCGEWWERKGGVALWVLR